MSPGHQGRLLGPALLNFYNNEIYSAENDSKVAVAVYANDSEPQCSVRQWLRYYRNPLERLFQK